MSQAPPRPSARASAPLRPTRGAAPRLRGRAFALAAALALLGLLAAAPLTAAPAPNESGIVDIDTNLALEQESAAGTGLVLTGSGEVLTNNHVIRGATAIRVVEPGSGASYSARVVGYDASADVALLQISGGSRFPVVRPGDSARASVGEAVTAIGNAGGVGGSPRVTTGKILALHQSLSVADDQGEFERLHELIETNASLQPGDSGGPLLDPAGAVIGMDTAAASGFQFQPGSSQGFAIPIDEALALARQIEAGHASSAVHVGTTPFLGVEIESPDGGFGPSGATTGALVSEVVPSSPAERAGVIDGDVITSLDGRKVVSYAAIPGLILAVAPGAEVELGWVDQSGIAHRTRVRLATGPPQ